MGFLQRGLLLYLGIAIAICFACPQFIFNSNNSADNTVLGFFNLQYDGSSNGINGVSINNNTVLAGNAGSIANNSFTSATNPAGAQGILGFIDPIFQVFSWIKLFFKVLFSPIILLTSPAMSGAPSGLIFFIAIPVVFMTLLGLIFWIRGGMP